MVDNLCLSQESGGFSQKKSKSSKPLSQKQTDESFEAMVSSVGILQYGSGEIYEGQLFNGKRSGKGKMTFPNGDKYIGNWRLDQMCDNDGTYHFRNGNEYKGQYKTFSNKHGIIDGNGQLKIVGFGIYTGRFSMGNINGPGKIEF